jgi:hypothetical protein
MGPCCGRPRCIGNVSYEVMYNRTLQARGLSIIPSSRIDTTAARCFLNVIDILYPQNKIFADSN